MDHEFALRLVVFEYLLPLQRKMRNKYIAVCLRNTCITRFFVESEPNCSRKADPSSGFRTFQAGDFTASGRINLTN